MGPPVMCAKCFQLKKPIESQVKFFVVASCKHFADAVYYINRTEGEENADIEQRNGRGSVSVGQVANI